MSVSSAPVCTVLGGANGSGKSSLYELIELPGEFVNADVVARQLDPEHPEAVSLAAGKRVLKRLGELIKDRRDLVYETTLSGRQPLEMMKVAKQRGYRVDLAFVILADVELNVSSVAQRVAEGGHGGTTVHLNDSLTHCDCRSRRGVRQHGKASACAHPHASWRCD